MAPHTYSDRTNTCHAGSKVGEAETTEMKGRAKVGHRLKSVLPLRRRAQDGRLA